MRWLIKLTICFAFFSVLLACKSENSEKDQESVQMNDPKVLDGKFEENYSDGKPKIEGIYKSGKKDGLWKYFYEQNPLRAKLELYSLDTLKGIGEMKWNDSTYTTIDRKEITFFLPNDTFRKTWGFDEEGTQTYYSASWKSSKVDTVVFLRAGGDTASFSTANNGTVIKSWRR